MIAATVTGPITLLVAPEQAAWIRGRMIATAVLVLETDGIEHRRTLVSRRELHSRPPFADTQHFRAEYLGTELTIDAEIPDVAIGGELSIVGYGYPEVSR